MPESSQDISGILIVDKPAGLTSHDVVQRVRRLIHQRQVGHVGTLDPMATGVLVICIGQATRLSQYMMGHDKHYLARVRLGQQTDTYDADGRITREHAGPLPDRSRVERALSLFRGQILQKPPLYSAIKINGQPLHRRARRGEQIELPERLVTVHHLELADWNVPWLTLSIVCAAGTYIRSLAHELGQTLGCGAHLSGLARVRSGPFHLGAAIPLEFLEVIGREGKWHRYLLPLDAGLDNMGILLVNHEEAQRIQGGMPIVGPPPRNGPRARVYSQAGDLLSIAYFDAATTRWRPEKVLVRY